MKVIQQPIRSNRRVRCEWTVNGMCATPLNSTLLRCHELPNKRKLLCRSIQLVYIFCVVSPRPPTEPFSLPFVLAFSLFFTPRSVQIQSISAASLAYAEVLIAEIALRNRERITLVLPLLLEHYRWRFLGLLLSLLLL